MDSPVKSLTHNREDLASGGIKAARTLAKNPNTAGSVTESTKNTAVSSHNSHLNAPSKILNYYNNFEQLIQQKKVITSSTIKKSKLFSNDSSARMKNESLQLNKQKHSDFKGQIYLTGEGAS